MESELKEVLYREYPFQYNHKRHLHWPQLGDINHNKCFYSKHYCVSRKFQFMKTHTPHSSILSIHSPRQGGCCSSLLTDTAVRVETDVKVSPVPSLLYQYSLWKPFKSYNQLLCGFAFPDSTKWRMGIPPSAPSLPFTWVLQVRWHPQCDRPEMRIKMSTSSHLCL